LGDSLSRQYCTDT